MALKSVYEKVFGIELGPNEFDVYEIKEVDGMRNRIAELERERSLVRIRERACADREALDRAARAVPAVLDAAVRLIEIKSRHVPHLSVGDAVLPMISNMLGAIRLGLTEENAEKVARRIGEGV